VGAQRGRGKRKEKLQTDSALEHRAWGRALSHDPEIMTWTETKSQTLNQLCHPGAPLFITFFKQFGWDVSWYGFSMFIYLSWGLLGFLNLMLILFMKTQICQPLHLHIFFCSLTIPNILLSFWDSNFTYDKAFYLVPQVIVVLFIFLVLFHSVLSFR